MISRLVLNLRQEDLVRTAMSRLMKYPLPDRVKRFGLRDDQRGRPGTTITKDLLDLDVDEPKFLKALCNELFSMEHSDAHALAKRIGEHL